VNGEKYVFSKDVLENGQNLYNFFTNFQKDIQSFHAK
jgi:hypothetical protein